VVDYSFMSVTFL